MKSFFFLSLTIVCLSLSGQTKILNPQEFRLDSLVLCGADETYTIDIFGIPEKVQYGGRDLITLGDGIDDTNLSTTVFYYPSLKMFFYTYEIYQWVYKVYVTTSETNVHLGKGLDFRVGDTVQGVMTKMNDYMTPKDKNKINKGNYTLSFKAPSVSKECAMTGFVRFSVNTSGQITEISVGMLKN